MLYRYGIIVLLKMYDTNNIPVQHTAWKLENHTVLVRNPEVGLWRKWCTCISVGMALCSRVLMICVVATEVTQARYLAMNNSYSNVWMWQSSPESDRGLCLQTWIRKHLSLDGSRKVRKGQWWHVRGKWSPRWKGVDQTRKFVKMFLAVVSIGSAMPFTEHHHAVCLMPHFEACGKFAFCRCEGLCCGRSC
jgi:hypothetical protein